MPTRILGLSAYYHDSAACLVVDGKIVAAAQEERFTRVKHDAGFPTHAARYCLAVAGMEAKELDVVAFYDKPLLKFERLFETYIDYAPKGFRSFLQAMPLWMKDKLWMSDAIQRELGYTGTILFGEHHESHAASAFYPSPYEEAAILTMDGVGEWATSSISHGKGNAITFLSELRFPHSLGLLYSAFTYFTGFKVNSGEYKLMGLAPYGEPKYVDVIKEKLVTVFDDGSIRLNLSYFDFAAGLRMTGERFGDLFGGPARQPETNLTQREMDLARSIQEVTEEIVLKMARHAKERTGARHLAMAGGVALNCVANGRLLREGTFEDLWIQPAAGDAGGAVGAALSVWHRYLGKERTSDEAKGTWEKPSRKAGAVEKYADGMNGAYLGPAFSADEIAGWLSKEKLPYRTVESADLAATVAKLLAEEKVVGLLQGRMEFGPRALGGRSILGDPRSPKMQSVMNLKIKFRESFRPFAPSVLREKVGEWFEFEGDSPYMLLTADVVKSRRRAMTAEENALWGIEKLNVPRS
ncbi:MAG TPA: carbamoyltransferase N-terminal domain-containing protein, partial [Thermoanaerobaculia bacterium]|nr:carbamoyltransferase N-terminal domain-containing protein [Thermoanaerobaculia bacterium]